MGRGCGSKEIEDVSRVWVTHTQALAGSTEGSARRLVQIESTGGSQARKWHDLSPQILLLMVKHSRVPV